MHLAGLSLLSLSVFAASAAASDLSKRGISTSLYNDFVYYWKYSTSSYSDTCAKPNGNTLVGYFTDAGTDTQGFVARDDTKKEIVVAFRGTSSQQDFTTDFNFELVPFVSTGVTPPAGTEVHPGFLSSYNSVVDKVLQFVKSEVSAHPGYTLISTGHSLGASLASIAAISLKANVPNVPIRAYTYGQPRTGNPTYAGYVDSLFGNSFYRVIHEADSVPTFVPQLFGYQHHGVEYWQNPGPPSADTVKQCSGDEDPSCSVSIPSTTFINQDHLVYFGIFFVTAFCT